MRNEQVLDGYGHQEPPVVCSLGVYRVQCAVYAAARIPLVPAVGVKVEFTNSGIACSSVRFKIPPMQYGIQNNYSCTYQSTLSVWRPAADLDRQRAERPPGRSMWRLKGAKMQIQIRARSRAPSQQVVPCNACNALQGLPGWLFRAVGAPGPRANQCAAARAARVHGAL